MKTISRISEIPKDEHFAVLINRSRSQDDGYDGTYLVHYVEYAFFDSEDALKDWLKFSSKDLIYRVIYTHPVTVETKVTVSKPGSYTGIRGGTLADVMDPT